MNCLAQLKFLPSVFTLVIDRMLAELDRRYGSYQNVQEQFRFFKLAEQTLQGHIEEVIQCRGVHSQAR